MKYCKKCLQPDTRPGILFDDSQICYACIYEESKKTVDWAKRWSQLCEIAEVAKQEARKRNAPYDCIVGVSGGKDSTFQAVIAKEKLGLNALLVNSVPDKITSIGQANIENLANLGFDVIHLRPNPQIARKLSHHSFVTMGNTGAHSEHALFASSFKIAERFSIPLVIQGENPALTLGTCLNTDTSGNAFNFAGFDTVKNSALSALPSGEFPSAALWMYQMPSAELLQKSNITAVWLQYFMKNWSQVGNADFSAARGLQGRMTEDLHSMGRYRRYTALDTDTVFVNQMLKYYKLGFGFATDEACYDIREGRLTREDAIWYVKEYDGKCGQEYIDFFCDYIEISLPVFWEIVDRFVNKNLFFKDNYGKWKPKFTVGTDFL